MSKKGFSKTLSILFIETVQSLSVAFDIVTTEFEWLQENWQYRKIPQQQQVPCKQHWTLSDTNQYHVHFFNTFMLAMPMKKRIPNTGELGLTQIKVASSISRNFLIMWFPFGKK